MASRGGGRVFNHEIQVMVKRQEDLSQEFEASLSMVRMMVAVMEKENKTEKVDELRSASLEMIRLMHELDCHSKSVSKVPQWYRAKKDDVTNFEERISSDAKTIATNSGFNEESHPLYRKFNECVWNVHHAGEPMPGQEEDEIVITSTATGTLNVTCPLTLKNVQDLVDPVCCYTCRHVYERSSILEFIGRHKVKPCPIAGCPRKVSAASLVADARLQMELREQRQTETSHAPEDYTEIE